MTYLSSCCVRPQSPFRTAWVTISLNGCYCQRICAVLLLQQSFVPTSYKMRLGPKNAITSLAFFRVGYSFIAFTLLGEAENPFSDSMKPKYCTCGFANTHFSGCSCKLALSNLCRTFSSLRPCSSADLENIRPSMKIQHSSPTRFFKTTSNSLWKLDGLFASPKGSLLNSVPEWHCKSCSFFVLFYRNLPKSIVTV